MVTTDPYPPHELGAWGERQAARALGRRGWKILARGYRHGRREIDLVVRRGETVAFVEVKTRTGEGFGGPEGAVHALKRREIEAVAHAYLTRHDLRDMDVRFDVVAIVIGPGRTIRRITHVEDAWRPSPR